MTKAGVAVYEDAVVIGTAVCLDRRHAFQNNALDAVSGVEIDDPAYRAHTLSLPRRHARSACRFPTGVPTRVIVAGVPGISSRRLLKRRMRSQPSTGGPRLSWFGSRRVRRTSR